MKKGLLISFVLILFLTQCTQKEVESEKKTKAEITRLHNQKTEATASVIPFAKTEVPILSEERKEELLQKLSVSKIFSDHIAFAENKGQLEKYFKVNVGKLGPVKFYTKGFAGTAYFSENGIGVGFVKGRLNKIFKSEFGMEMPNAPKTVKGYFESTGFNILFIGRNPELKMEGVSEGIPKLNYLKGNDPSLFLKDISTYQQILYKNLYQNIDLKYYLGEHELKYDYIVKPGANISDIRLKYEGVKSIHVNKKGELEIETDWGVLKDKKLYSYQIIEGKKKSVDVNYKVLGKNILAFEAKEYDKKHELIIDPPTLTWSTFINQGVVGDDGYFEDLAIDNSGNLYGTGWVHSNIFPATVTTYQGATTTTDLDAVVFKLSSDGTTLLYGTFIGGAGGVASTESGMGIDISSTGEAYISGRTNSNDFPMVSAHDNSYNGGQDIFVCRLNATGNTLLYSTYYGGGSDDGAYDLVLNKSTNDAYITGYTFSSGLQTAGNVYNAGQDSYVLKLNASGVRQFFVYYGGSGDDNAKGITVNSSGDAFIAGMTSSSNLPSVAGRYKTTISGGSDAYVARISNAGVIQYATYLGGLNPDMASTIEVNSSDEVFVAGVTDGPSFPTVNAHQSSSVAGLEAYLAKFNNDLTGLIYSTYVAGSGPEGDKGWVISPSEYHKPVSIDIDGDIVLLATVTGSANMTMASSVDNSQNGGYDYYVAIYEYSAPTLTLSFGTYLGGGANDYPTGGIVMDRSTPDGCFFVGGSTHSNNFPITGGTYQTVSATGNDQTTITKFCFPEILPVDYISFEGKYREEEIVLDWITSSEKNSAYFVIERSTDGVNFYTLGQVKAAGNAVELNSYIFIDTDPAHGNNYYRLKQYDLDGTFHYSKTINVRTGEDLQFIISPNPGDGLFTASGVLAEGSDVSVSVVNDVGQEILMQTVYKEKGSCELEIDLRNYADGMYILRISSGEFNQVVKLQKK